MLNDSVNHSLANKTRVLPLVLDRAAGSRMTTSPKSPPPHLTPEPRPDRRPPTQSRFHAFVDSVFDAYYDWHIRTGYMEFSAQMDALLGLPPEALQRAFTAWLDRLHPDDRAATVEAVHEAVREGGVYKGEYRLRRDDGTYVQVHDRGVVLRDEDGTSSHMVGAIRDITSDEEAERALHEAAELYRTLFENAVNSAFQIADDGRFLDANAAGALFMGTSRASFCGAAWAPCGAIERSGRCARPRRPASPPPSSSSSRSGTPSRRSRSPWYPAASEARPPASPWARTSPTTGPCARLSRSRKHRFAGRPLPCPTQHRSPRHPGTAKPRQGGARADHLRQRGDDDPAHARTAEKPLAATPEAIYLDAIARSLREVVSPPAAGARSCHGAGLPLTPSEREIAGLIRMGRSTSEIAEALYISPITVSFHRRNLRRKLGLGPPGQRLASHLGQSRKLEPRRAASAPG